MGVGSLYVHFPFCETKCHYCDFYSLGRERTRPTDAGDFEGALGREAALITDRLAPTLDTIFFGGGTPSMTPPESMARALAPLRLAERIDARTEWTMEANPSSIVEVEAGSPHASGRDRMRAYRRLGINRISMGVQSMREDLLKALGRVHGEEQVLRALDTVFSAGFENVSVDLLCGVPGQTIGDLENALGRLTAYPISHLSCYLLTLPKHHRMYPDLPDEDQQLAHLLLVDRWMRDAGFEHYEISNYARPGRRARHNMRYWQGAAYLGLGPSAHSFEPAQGLGRRWKNFSSLHKYAGTLATGELPIEWSEDLTERERELERWMLALRLAEGFPDDWLGAERDPRRLKSQALRQHGLLEIHPEQAGRLRLTARGFALSDQVISQLA